MLTWCLAARTQPEKRSHGPPLHTASASWLILFHLHGAITVFTAVIAKVGPDHPGAHSNCPNTQLQTNKEKITVANPL